jgi:hypothetical protein
VSHALMVNNRLMVTEGTIVGLMLIGLGIWGLYKSLDRWGGQGALYYLLSLFGAFLLLSALGWV